MSIWTAIKYAINSKIGTKEFKPLDELIKDLAKRDVIANTNILYDVIGTTISVPTSPYISIGNAIKINANGSISICGSTKRTTSGSTTIDLRIYRNGEVEIENNLQVTYNGETFSIPIAINEGDTISVMARAAGGGVTISNVYIGGTMIPINLVEIVPQ